MLCFSACKRSDPAFYLYYTNNYAGDSWQNHKTGLLWAMSYLGAGLPEGAIDKAIKWKDSVTFAFDVSHLGFDPVAAKAMKQVIDSIKSSESYLEKNKADLGLFISLTIGSSWHYYKITGMPERLDAFMKMHEVDHHKTFPVTRSTVARHHRLLKYYASSDDPLKWMFMAEESHGNIKIGSFEADVFEVFDIMRNGQLRFAVYDKNGKLTDASPKVYGDAGKPAKCLWCHEISILPLFGRNDTLEGFIPPQEFQDDILRLNNTLLKYRNSLKSDIHFVNTQDHTFMELEYISFMQPSAKKLAQEWDLEEAEVEALIKHVRKEEYREFKRLGDLVHRRDVNRLKDLFPESIREPSRFEPDFFSTRFRGASGK
jgi:hypothetical protein